jgi:nucleoside-diphosphate-sugar epimerase
VKKILITGGAGFIGFHLARKLLSRGYNIVLADNFSRGVNDKDLRKICQEEDISLVDCDLLDSDQVFSLGKDYEHIYHLAAIIGVRHVTERPYEVLANNINMLLHMIALGRNQKNLNKFIFSSTSEVYAGTLKYFEIPFPTPEDIPLTISDLSQARTSYMLSKIYGEALCMQSGLPYIIIRPHNFYGPRMGLSHVIPELLEKAYKTPDGGELSVSSVDHRRTFCYIDDAVEMIMRVVESSDCIMDTFNIGQQEQEISIGDLAKIILSVVGKNLLIVPKPEVTGSPERRCPDISRIFSIINYSPEVSLEEGVHKVFKWYCTNAFLGKEGSSL